MPDEFTLGYAAGWKNAIEAVMEIVKLILQHKRKEAAARAERGRQLYAFRVSEKRR